MVLLLISFVAGVLTVLAPCILPLLPVIVGGSLTGEEEKSKKRKKALVVTISLGISVLIFTFLLKISTIFINIPPQVWTWISGGIIVILGIFILFPTLWEKMKFVSKANKESNKLLAVGYKKDSLWGDIIIGASLGPVFTTCSPTYFFILATILPLQPVLGLIAILAYTIGLCLALLIIAFLGQKIIEKVGLASDPKGWIKRILGIIFIIVGIAILTGADKALQIKLLDSGFFDVTKVEQILLRNVSTSSDGEIIDMVSTSTPNLTSATTSKQFLPSEKERIMKKSQLYKRAPELVNPSGYINTNRKPITLAELKGKKVVLLDVWTFSCINCQRTFPYLRAWYEKYKDEGLEIVGLHTPEFGFEKVQKNVEDAVRKFEIKYPVVLDNEYATWRAYGNQYWPRKYLIDIDGFIIYDHIGEGDYDITEKYIQNALKERAEVLGDKMNIPSGITTPVDAIKPESGKVKSPEIYFGASRNERLGNGKVFTAGSQTFVRPTSIQLNTLYLVGSWNIEKEYAESKSENTSIIFKYNAKNVYMVVSAPTAIDMEVWVGGKLLKTISVLNEPLYTLVGGTDYGEHVLELKIKKANLQAFTFTFG